MDVVVSRTMTVFIDRVPNLDPITVYLNDFGSSKGKVTIECFGKAWSTYFGAMGDKTISAFLCSVDPEYLCSRMVDETKEIDFEKLLELCASEGLEIPEITEETDIFSVANDIERCLGPDWYLEIPKRPTREMVYFKRIIEAVQSGLAIADGSAIFEVAKTEGAV